MKRFDPLATTPERAAIRDAVRAICDRFDDAYWAEKDRTHSFPHEFAAAIAAGGWLGIAMPAEYGGAGLGVTEAAIMMQEIGHSAGAFAACSTVHINIFGLHSIVRHGTDAQRAAWLPAIIDGTSRACFGVTEPDAGLDTAADQDPSGAPRRPLPASAARKSGPAPPSRPTRSCCWPRTTPLEDVRPSDRRPVAVLRRPRPLRRRNPGNPEDGPPRRRFEPGLLRQHDRARSNAGSARRAGVSATSSTASIRNASSTPPRSSAWAAARSNKAVAYADERVVFGRKIGQNQSIQHPAGRMLVGTLRRRTDDAARRRTLRLRPALRRAGQRRQIPRRRCRIQACDRAIRTHGGMGYAAEYHVERYFREMVATQLAPVSREMILCFIAERELGLPKSY